MKKILIVALTAVIALSITACKDPAETSSSANSTNSSAVSATSDSASTQGSESLVSDDKIIINYPDDSTEQTQDGSEGSNSTSANASTSGNESSSTTTTASSDESSSGDESTSNGDSGNTITPSVDEYGDNVINFEDLLG